MKRIISIILAVALCLSLCACGVDEKYTALLEHLDANNYEGIKAELMLLSPDFKAVQEQAAANAEILAKYQDLITLLEAEDYVSASANIASKIPVPEGPSREDMFVEIELTAENINDYIELLPFESEELDGFGNGTNIFHCGVAMSSKVYDEGLVYYSSENVAIEVIFSADYEDAVGYFDNNGYYSNGSHSWGWENGYTVIEQPFTQVLWAAFFEPETQPFPDFHPELLSFGQAKGTITFVKSEYIESIDEEGGITVVNGDLWYPYTWPSNQSRPKDIVA